MPAVATAASALVCPAAEPIEDARGKGPGCHCHIANVTLSRESDSNSLKRFCAGGYQDCPILRRRRRAFYRDTHRELGREIDASTPKEER